MTDEPGSKAPFIVYGAIFAIGIVCVGAVVINDCQRDAPYQDSEPVKAGDPPPPSLPPPPDRPRPK